MDSYYCTRCGWMYDEARGHARSDLPPGTRWEDVPADFQCPDCGAPKSEFAKD
jgi:rubredoxin